MKIMFPKTLSIILAIHIYAILLFASCEEDITGETNNIDNRYCNIYDPLSDCYDQTRKAPIPTEKCFKAAVYEHVRLDGKSMQEMQERNLKLFDEVAQVASSKGARIIVFPEDGIFHGPKTWVFKGLSEIPDPQALTDRDKNPCLKHRDNNDSFILRELSCIARKHKIYVVANFGTRQDCTPGENVSPTQICPDRGFLALNTDVVLDDKGDFIRRYRKHNLYIEIFDDTPSLEVVHFDTPFGRCGVFTCFDIMFRSPAIDLVEKYHIDTAIFPTWWFDELPILSAIQFQNAWSRMNKVNLLASNMHKRELGSVGSGIFTDKQIVYVGAGGKGPKLIVATVPSSHDHKGCDNYQEVIEIGPKDKPEPGYQFAHYKLLNDDSVHLFTNQMEANRTLCNQQFCCDINYKITSLLVPGGMDRLALIIRDNTRVGKFNMFEQVCQLVTLVDRFDPNKLSSVEYSTEPVAEFEHLSIESKFSSKYVYPISASSVDKLIDRPDTSYGCAKTGQPSQLYNCGLSYQGKSVPIYSFGLYARLYECDVMEK